MTKQITVETQLGAGGGWYVEYRAAAGPRNLLTAFVRAAEARRETRGVGGYRTLVLIDGSAAIEFGEPAPTTLAKARAILESA